ncbi:ATP-binding cassette domain-containing protein [uncultured Desulfovibrio sp.]|uniref:ATP-binding cassette domain-containing protein n=1 Tax=uncultured Desulfovibrio sp. TaxID=167968 RepID=UPI003433AC3F
MLEIRHLSYQVSDESGEELGILNDVSLTIAEHKFVVITGPNGGGKTTLAKAIMGLVTPTGGQILWNGEDITSLNITQRARKGISYGFQQPPRFKGLRVRDLLELASGREGLTHDEECQYLTRVGLCAADYIDREVDASLSGGEVKRIEIATILAPRPALICGPSPGSPTPSASSTTSRRPPWWSSPTRSASSTWPMRSSWWTTASSPSTAPRPRSFPRSWPTPCRAAVICTRAD